MSKAFTKEGDGADDEDEIAADRPIDYKNYVTPRGFEAMRDEWRQLMRVERPKVVEVVSWAAGNGDRSENGDYIYGKKRLREIDRRVRYLTKSLESAVVVDPQQQKNRDQAFFGATVCYARADGSKQCVMIVGVDEAELSAGKISWISPIAKALLKARAGDEVGVRTPSGVEYVEILSVVYDV